MLKALIKKVASQVWGGLVYLNDVWLAIITNFAIMTLLGTATRFIQDYYFNEDYREINPEEFIQTLNLMSLSPLQFGMLPSVGYLLVRFLWVGTSEEGIFRALLMDSFLEKFCKAPVWLSVTLSSLIFGAVHLLNPGGWFYRMPQAVGAAGAGFFLAYLYKKRGYSFASVVHWLYDFCVVYAATRGFLGYITAHIGSF